MDNPKRMRALAPPLAWRNEAVLLVGFVVIISIKGRLQYTGTAVQLMGKSRIMQAPAHPHAFRNDIAR